jgi:ubiquitin-like-conjugating enzyme ATG3
MEQLADAVRLFRTSREWIAPILTQSAFLERGVLTPDEFVRAGDHLVACCPSWRWEEGESSKIKPFLPPKKQFLSTRSVPSFRRVANLNATSVDEKTVTLEGGSEWEAPTLSTLNDEDFDGEVLVDLKDVLSEQPKSPKKTTLMTDKKAPSIETKPAASKEDEYLDMEDFSLALDDDAVAPPSSSSIQSLPAGVTSTNQSSASSSIFMSSSSVVKTRRYDISITYDKYYQTPR